MRELRRFPRREREHLSDVQSNSTQLCTKTPKMKVPPRRKLIRPPQFTVADENTLKKILSPPSKPVPEFQGTKYIHGMKPGDALIYHCKEPNCEASFTNFTALKLHSNKHLKRTIRCQFCGMIFKEQNDLQQHNDQFHPDIHRNPHSDPLKCKKCGKCSRDKRALWRHVRESHRNEDYKCPHCNFLFTRPENLKDHLRSKHLPEGKQQKFICKTCGNIYTYHSSLKSHIRDIHRGRENPLKCCLCDTVYWTLGSYKGHMRRHTHPKFIRCITCNATFSSLNKLRRHNTSRQHKEKVQKESRVARKSTNKETSFKRKLLHKHVTPASNSNLNLTKNDKLIQLCNKKPLKIILHRVDQHITTKSIANKDHQYQLSLTASSFGKKEEDLHLDCVYCEKTFRNLESVNAHEIICYMKYRYAKIHICPICNKEFDKAYKLEKHSPVHSNDRPYRCTYCDKPFKSTSTLIQHEKSLHFGIKYKPAVSRVYGCNYAGCNKKYKADKTLHMHIASCHLGIRFNCEKCGRVYRRKDQLRKHLRIDHAECPTRLGCQPCGRTYKDRLTYLAHLERPRHHRKVLECEKKVNKGKKK
ncbi:unnamed protein product [Orchesella dallaii]|uniref:Zinc finger protein n=1 Tax=Orchesella dallaii TaxID=48710 RepID=A0ABP1S3E6_9HEXA